MSEPGTQTGIRMIDPPGGHRYGFPKPLTAQAGESIDAWLVDNGYPRELVDQYPHGVPCRKWIRKRTGFTEGEIAEGGSDDPPDESIDELQG